MLAGHWLFFLYICKWTDWWYAPTWVFVVLWTIFILGIIVAIVKSTKKED